LVKLNYIQVRRHLAILYKRFLCHQLGTSHAMWLAARQAAALTTLKRLTQRGAPSSLAAPTSSSSSMTSAAPVADRLLTTGAAGNLLPVDLCVERCPSAAWRIEGLAASSSSAVGS
jgi:hypothetical protein